MYIILFGLSNAAVTAGVIQAIISAYMEVNDNRQAASEVEKGCA